MYKQFGISDELLELSKKAELEVQEQFKKIEEVCEYNSLKVLSAFQKYNVSEMHFNSTTGYGYSDVGRDTIEKNICRNITYRGQFSKRTVYIRNSCINSSFICIFKTK